MSNAKMIVASGFLAASLLIFSAAPTMAAETTAVRGAQKIRPQLRDPAISGREAALIRHEIKDHKQLKRMAWSDGELSRSEKARLAYDAGKVRKLVNRAKNN